MTDDLRYPSLRSILEYMETNKRIYVASRCPRLFHIEKSIPLRIHNLSFKHNLICINDLTYSLSISSQQYAANLLETRNHIATFKLMAGDVRIDSPPVFCNFVEIKFSTKSEFSRVRQLPAHIEIQVAMKKLIAFLLGGRKSIKVIDSLDLDFDMGAVLRIPEGLKMWTRGLNTYRRDFKSFLFLVDPSSFPLKTLVVKITDPSDFKHPVVSTVKDLVLRMIFENEGDGIEYLEVPNWIPELLQFSHKSVHLRGYYLSIENLIGIIGYWKEHGKETGTRWSLDKQNRDTVVDTMKNLKKEFGGC